MCKSKVQICADDVLCKENYIKENDRLENAVKIILYIISILDIWTERLRKHQQLNIVLTKYNIASHIYSTLAPRGRGRWPRTRASTGAAPAPCSRWRPGGGAAAGAPPPASSSASRTASPRSSGGPGHKYIFLDAKAR